MGPVLIRQNHTFRLEQRPQQQTRQAVPPRQVSNVQNLVVTLPGLMATQPPMAAPRNHADAVSLLGEFLAHQHMRGPAAFFDLFEPVPRGVAPSVIEANTTTLLHEVSAAERSGGSLQSQCSVCLEQFKPGEELRMLPCMHRYHRGCIDRWFARSAACPVCKHEITR